MTIATARKTRDSTSKSSLKNINSQAIKLRFITASLDMGVRLFVAVVPFIVVGVKLDEHFACSPLFTVSGLIIATTAGSYVVWQAVKKANLNVYKGNSI